MSAPTTESRAQFRRGPEARRMSRARGVRDDVTSKVIVGIIVLILLLLLGLPLSQLVTRALGPDGREVLLGFFTDPNHRAVLANSLMLGAIVGVTGTAVGFIVAFTQVRVKFRGKRALHLIALIPIVSPPFAVATAAITLFGRNGYISSNLLGIQGDIYGLHGLVFVYTLSFFPVAYMNFKGMLENLDPSLEEAASGLGAGKLKILLTVTFPMLLPGFAASFLVLFVEGIADLSNPLVLGGDYAVLSTRAYFAMTGDFNIGAGAAYSLMLVLPALLVFLVQRYWLNRKKVTAVTGKPSGRMQAISAPSVRIPSLILTAGIVAVIALVYLTVILGGFQRVPGVNNELTLDHFEFVLTGIGSQAMRDTITLALIAAPVAGVLGMLIGWLVTRKLKRFAGLLDFAGMLGTAFPGTVLGIGYAIAFLVPTTVLGIEILPPLAGGAAAFGGAIAIVMVFTVRSLPPGQRTGIAALSQIDSSIDEASTSLGAGSATTFRRVTLPLIRPAFATALTFATARSMTSLSPIIFLTTPEIKILTSQILAEVDNGRYGNAFAYCTVLVIIVLLLITLVNFLLRKVVHRGNQFDA